MLPYPDVPNPMMQFQLGETVDIHGRRSLYRRAFVFSGSPGRFMTWLKWVKYI